MIVGGDIGEVGRAALQREDHRLLAVGLDVGDDVERRLDRRLRILAAVIIVGLDDVVGGDVLAVVEGRALAQLEHPLGGAVGGLEALGQMRLNGGLLVDLGELGAEDADRHAELEAVGPGRRVERVGGGAMADADLERAALLGFGARGAHEQRIGGREREAAGQRQLHEVAARHPALGDEPCWRCLILFSKSLIDVYSLLTDRLGRPSYLFDLLCRC